MKKTTCIVITCCLMITLIGCSKYPSSYPQLIVVGDNIKSEATVNGATWFDGEGGSSSDLGDWDIEIANIIKPVDAKAGSMLNLNLTYTKGIQNFKVCKVQGTSKDNQKLTDVTVDGYKLHVPAEKGLHIYTVSVVWDTKHTVNYVFKINVD